MTPEEHMAKQCSKMAERGAAHGWEVSWTRLGAGGSTAVSTFECVAARGQEQIRIWWEDGKLIEAPTYDLAGRTTKLRNLSACLQQMEKQPDFKKAAKAARRQNKLTSTTEIDIRQDPTTLPWYADDGQSPPSDADILKACYSRQITWRNTITGDVEVDRVVRSKNPELLKGNFNSLNYFISRSSKGRVILNFLGQHGYRAVALDMILRVGG